MQNELAVSSQLWALTVVSERHCLLVFSLYLHLQAFIQLAKYMIMDKVSVSINRWHLYIDTWPAIVAVCGSS